MNQRAPIHAQRSDPLRSTNQRERERALIQKPELRSTPIHEPERTSSDPQTRAPIHEPALLSTNKLRSNSAKRTPVQPLRSPSQTLITVSFPSPVHRPHTHLTGPISAFIYIYIYLFIYLFIYFFLFIKFFNYQCFIKLCIYGLCI